MERNRIREKLVLIFTEQLGVDEDEITDDAEIGDDLGADSLDIVELVMTAEEDFDLEINDDEIEEIQRFKDVVDFIERKLAAKPKKS